MIDKTLIRGATKGIEQTTMKVPENINKTLLRGASKETIFKELGEII